MSFSVIIPARLASTRLPGKPLADLHGLPMIVHVAQRAARSQARQVIVATDAAAVHEACQTHGIQAILTRGDHPSGSDRLAEACELLKLGADEVVVNVQGDEPLIDPNLINACATTLIERPDCVMSTVAHGLHDAADFSNPNIVKVVLDAQQRALYFSRAPIPWWRDGSTPAAPQVSPQAPPLRHVGLYAYRADFLRHFPQLSPSPLEQIEALEQLRVLWHGERIAVHVTDTVPGSGVDTPEDLARVRALMAASDHAG